MVSFFSTDIQNLRNLWSFFVMNLEVLKQIQDMHGDLNKQKW